MKKIFFATFFALIFLTSINISEAATIYALPEYDTLNIGQEFFVDIKINTEEDFINAVQTTVTFPAHIEITNSDKHNSVFNFWVEDPNISENKDKITFVGGTAKGVSGKSLQVLRIKCKSVGTGAGIVEMTESVITANDGRGTNVLSSIENASITVGVNVKMPETSEIVEEVVIVPQVIEREAVLAKDLPSLPELKVPLYPDPELWYSHQGETIVLWDVPDDITKVALSVDDNPNSEPETSEEGLYTGKNIGSLEEGTHYVHVQFKNNKGWGEVAHYKISIDTVSPSPFEIEISSFASTNPSPEITFRSEDSLSGYSHALVFIDTNERIPVEGTSLVIPVQELGSHSLIVRVFDYAGNSVEDDINYEILPLQTPIINYFTKKISQDEKVFISGTSIPQASVILKIKREGEIISEEIMETNELGSWEGVLNTLLNKGVYTLTVTVKDEREAISLESEQIEIKITAQTILSLGLVDLGWFEIFIIIMLIILIGGGSGIWYYLSQKEMKEAYKIIANRDVKKMSKLLTDDIIVIEKGIKDEKKISAGGKSLIKNHINKLKTNVKKMDKYLGIGISKSK